jgi:WD40 repeat protein
MRYIALLVLIVIFSLSPTTAQHPPDSPIITPENLDQVRELQRIGRGVLVDAQYSPTGDQIAVTSSIGIWLYDTSDLSAEPRLLEGHFEYVRGGGYSPDGTQLVSYASDGSETSVALVWDATNGNLLFTLDLALHPQGMRDAGFSVDGQTIFTENYYDDIHLWDVNTGAFLGTQTNKPITPARLTRHPNDTQQLERTYDSVHILHTETGAVIHTLTGFTHPYYKAQFSPDGTWIATISYDRDTIWIFDAQTGELRQTIHQDTIILPTSLDISPDGAVILLAYDNQTLRLLDATTGAVIQTFSGHRNTIHSASFSTSGRYIISASLDKTARIWDATTGNLLHTIEHTYPVYASSFSPDETVIVTSEIDLYGTSVSVNIWDATTFTLIHDYNHQVYGLSFHPTLPMFVKYNRDNFGFFWLMPLSNGTHATYEQTGVYHDATFSPNGLIVVGGGRYKSLTLQTILPQAPIYLDGHSGYLNSVNFSADGRYILTSSTDGTLRIWGVPPS